MSEPPIPDSGGLVAPRIRARRKVPSLIWLVPIAAAVLGLSLVVNAWRSAGPRITISLETAEGLEVGKTQVRYRNVSVGHVTAITLNPDHHDIVITADLDKSAETMSRADSHFWVVRPRVGVGWASGLDTLLSGAFIGVETGESTTPQLHFVGLETPPPLPHALHGKRVVLHASDLGSVSLGAPVYFKRLQVGRIIDELLEPDGRGAQLVAFIDAPNDRFISGSSRFWNASGIDIRVGANGMNLKAESFASLIVGGIEFDVGRAADGHSSNGPLDQFFLYKDEAAATAPSEGEPRLVRMRFDQSLRGLSVGAPLEFVGVEIGHVISIDLDYETKTRRFPRIVMAQIYPQRMGRAYDILSAQGTTESSEKMAMLVGQLVARGLRVQPRQGSLLTGQLYLALDFLRSTPRVQFNSAARPLELPTVRGSVDQLQYQLTSIVRKIDRLPLDELARHLDADLISLHSTTEALNGELLPGAAVALRSLKSTLGTVDRTLATDAPWRDNLQQTMEEARLALQSVRSLADLIGRHPESLIRGRKQFQEKRAAPSTASETSHE